jgi:hypothetical protein
MRNGHIAWVRAGLSVSGRFMGRDTDAGLAYVKTTQAGQVSFSPPVDLRHQLAGVPAGTAITITYLGQQGGRKVFRVTRRDAALTAVTRA